MIGIFVEKSANKKQVASFSGGRTSAYMCHKLKEIYGDEVDFIFMDTGAEHPKTYEFIRKVNDAFDLNLVCLRVDINPELGKGNGYKVVSIDDIGPDLIPFRDMMSKYGTPYVRGAFCTEMMKSKPFMSYCGDAYGKDGYTCWMGMRADEPQRLKAMPDRNADMFGGKPKQKRSIKYLAEISDFDKNDVLEWWESQSFDLDIVEPLGNCVFCVKKGLNKLALAAKLEPEMSRDFLGLIASDSVRQIPERAMPSDIMYRDGHSLQSIIDSYADIPTTQIEKSIRSMRQNDTGSCSESCEASSDNLDLFDE